MGYGDIPEKGLTIFITAAEQLFSITGKTVLILADKSGKLTIWTGKTAYKGVQTIVKAFGP